MRLWHNNLARCLLELSDQINSGCVCVCTRWAGNYYFSTPESGGIRRVRGRPMQILIRIYNIHTMYCSRANMLCRLCVHMCVCVCVLTRINNNNNNIKWKKNTQRTVYLRKIVNNNEYLYYGLWLCVRTVLYIIVYYYRGNKKINAPPFDLNGAMRIYIFCIQFHRRV